MDKAAQVGQRALEALRAAKRQLACFIRLLGPPGDGIQADGSAWLIFLAADGIFKFGTELAGLGIEKHGGHHQDHRARFYVQRFYV
ncbi:hypothetical protein D3C78_1532650 [compost metagenome]